MISAANAGSPGREGPLTHRVYTAFVCSAYIERQVVPIVHVQLRRKGATFCGRVAEMVEDFTFDGKEWFRVDCAELGRVAVESRNLRLCSGDGRCVCEAEA